MSAKRSRMVARDFKCGGLWRWMDAFVSSRTSVIPDEDGPDE